jgi:hypothetical protein
MAAYPRWLPLDGRIQDDCPSKMAAQIFSHI